MKVVKKLFTTCEVCLINQFYYSDDGDRYDSDSENGSHARKGREYRDKDSDSLDSAEKKDRNTSKSSTPSRTKPTSGIKKIDLGAAAHYGKNQGSQVSTNNFLIDSDVFI